MKREKKWGFIKAWDCKWGLTLEWKFQWERAWDWFCEWKWNGRQDTYRNGNEHLNEIIYLYGHQNCYKKIRFFVYF